MNWQRVSKANKCPVCGHDHWCWITPKRDAVLCMWEMSGSPYTLSTGETGYFHNLSNVKGNAKSWRWTFSAPQRPVINVCKLMGQWLYETTQVRLEQFARNLGVQTAALSALRCAWVSQDNLRALSGHKDAKSGAWAFPMTDGYGNFTGIRLRSPDGFKFAVRGSHQGLFVPLAQPQKDLLICEGPTDTAAALSLGFFAIGRPNCCGGVPHALALSGRLRPRGLCRIIIISDNDERGADGAAMLQRHLRLPTSILTLPAKDLRQFVELGGTAELLKSMINTLIWHENSHRND